MTREILNDKDIELLRAKRAARGEGAGLKKDPLAKEANDYKDRLIKYIPAEAISVYLAINGIISTANRPEDKTQLVFWIAFAALLFLLPLYMYRLLGIVKKETIVLSMVSFIVWVFALGGPFSYYEWYDPLYATILVPLYTFAVACWPTRETIAS